MRDRRAIRPWATAAALLALTTAGVHAQTFDRFFTTAAERRMLDDARAEFQAPAPVVPVQQPVAAAEPEGPVLPAITVSGVVLRGRGGDTSWINGTRIRPDEVTPEGIRVRPAGGADTLVQIQLPDSRRPLSLKPGQRIDLETGAVLEVYERHADEPRESVFDTLAPARTPAGDDGEPAAGG